MPGTPTVAVGIGGAGCRMLAALDRAAREGGDREGFRLIAVDSNEADLEDTTGDLPPETRLALDRDGPTWERARAEWGYLRPDATLPNVGGATRRREVGRYYAESPENLRRLCRVLADRTEDFLDARDPDGVNAWVLAALGGGTGSGAAPLVAALSREVLGTAAPDGTDVRLYGVGSLPRLDRVATRFVAPDADPRHSVNAYTSLKELRALIDDRDAEIRLHADADGITRDALRIEGRLFERYFLLGFREDGDRPSRRAANEAAADLVRYYARTPAGDFPPVAPDGNGLCSLDAAALRFPVERATEYVERGRRRRELDGELERRRRELERRRVDADYLADALSVRRGELPDPTSRVDSALVRACRRRAADLGLPADEEAMTRTAEEAAADLLEAELASLAGRDFDAAVVVRRFYYDQLLERVEKAVRDHGFEREVENAWERYREEVSAAAGRGVAGDLDAADAEHKWERGLEPFLEAELARLHEERENRWLITAPIEAEIEEIEAIRGWLRGLYDERNRLRATRDACEALRARARDRLREERDAIEEDLAELEAEITKREREATEIDARLDRLETELTTARERRRATMPLADLEGLGDLIENVEEASVGDLIEEGVLDESALCRRLRALCFDLDEPVEDLPGGTAASLGALAPLIGEGDAGSDWPAAVTAAGREAGFEAVADPAPLAGPLSVHLLAVYAGVDLERTSEFGTLDEHHTDPERSVSELLAGEPDEDLDAHASPAYPELLE